MSTEDIQQLRKELKNWESAFYTVHQRKPEKKDIAEAPKEIKEKYQVYFQKKAVTPEFGAKEVPRDLTEPQTDKSGVWGSEFNKTADEKNGLEATTNKSITPRASLDKLGAKLFQTFARNQSPLCGKPRGVFKKHEDSASPVTGNIYGVRTEASTSQVFGEKKKHVADSSNVQNRSDTSGAVGRFHESSNEKSCLDSQDDFVVKGELFKGAERLFSPRTGASKSLSHQKPKPRLSFLSVNMPVSFRDGNSSDDEIYQKDISDASENRSVRSGNLEACSDIYRESGGKDTFLNEDKIFPPIKEKVRSSSMGNLKASKNLNEELPDEKRYDSHEYFDKDEEILFDDSMQKSGYSKYASDISPQIHQRRKKNNSNPKSTGRKDLAAFQGCSENTLQTTPSVLVSSIDPADSHVKGDLSLQQNCIVKNILPFESDISLAPSVVIAKTGPERCNTGKAERSRTTSRASKSFPNECSGSKKTVVIEDGSEGNTVLPKKSGQGKRKRTLDMSEECSRDDADDSVSEEHHQDRVKADKSAVVAGSSSSSRVQPHKPSQRKKSTASLSENFVCLNMKRKGYRRKGAGMTGPQLRRKQWKAKMAARSKSYGSNKCFKCGQEGHWASKCTGQSGSRQDWNPTDINELPVEESEFPSLREAALMSRGIKEEWSNLGLTRCSEIRIRKLEFEILRPLDLLLSGLMTWQRN